MVYVFPDNPRAAILAKSFRLRYEPLLKKIQVRHGVLVGCGYMQEVVYDLPQKLLVPLCRDFVGVLLESYHLLLSSYKHVSINVRNDLGLNVGMVLYGEQNGFGWLLRVSFGTTLVASLVIVFAAIQVVIATAQKCVSLLLTHQQLHP